MSYKNPQMRLAIALVLALVASFPVAASAHGRPPFIGDIAFHPTDPNLIVARATWGLVISEDGGESWRWLCAAVTGADPTREDPKILVMPDGSILLGTFGGLSRSAPDRCSFTHPAELNDRYIIDLYARPAEPGTVWAVATSGTEADEIYRSIDEGLTWSALGAPIDEVLVERVRVAPSDASRVYLSGAIPVMTMRIDAGLGPDGGMPDGGSVVMTPRRGFFLRSRDGGESYEQIEMPLAEGERNVHLLAVDPTDPDRALVRMTRRTADPADDRVLLTEDAGESWAPVMETRRVSGAAFTEDGSTVYVTSSELGGVSRSDDGGRSFSQLGMLSHPCLGVRGDQVWTCVNELFDGFAMGLSTDRGETIEPRLVFADIHTLVPCAACTEVGHVCPMWFPDLAYDLRLDGGSLPDGSVTGAGRDAGALPDCQPEDDCGCHAAGSRPLPKRWLFVLLTAGFLGLRRRHRG